MIYVFRILYILIPLRSVFTNDVHYLKYRNSMKQIHTLHANQSQSTFKIFCPNFFSGLLQRGPWGSG